MKIIEMYLRDLRKYFLTNLARKIFFVTESFYVFIITGGTLFNTQPPTFKDRHIEDIKSKFYIMEVVRIDGHLYISNLNMDVLRKTLKIVAEIR